MRLLRAVLCSAGVASAGYGAFLLATTLSLWQLIALAVWLAAMVVVHDGVLVPTVSVIRGGWYRRADARPAAVTAVVHVGFVVGGILTLFVVPEIWAQEKGNPNPTILVGDYAMRLVAVWLVIATIAFVVTRVVNRRSRR